MFAGPICNLWCNLIYRQNLVLGALFIVLSELMFASMGAGIKVLAATLPNEMIVFGRNALGLLLVTPLLLRNGLQAVSTQVPRLHLQRAVVGVSAMYCFYYALGHMLLAQGMLLKMTTPLFMPVIAWLWLRETTSAWVLVAVPTGFIGVALVVDPSSDTSWIALVGLAGGALAAWAKVTVRRLTHSEPALRVVFYFALLSALISSIPLLWAWQTPTQFEMLYLLLVAACATGGQIFLTRGYAAAPASIVSPFTYVSVIFATIYGYLFWDEHITLQFVFGALLIAGAGVLALTARHMVAQSNNTAVEPTGSTQP